jgi:hypothetical protein
MEMIDKRPAVGRYVLKPSVFTHGFVGRGGVITKVSGNRIYYKDKDGDEFHCSRFAAICDTQEEVALLVEFDRSAREAAIALQREHAAQFKRYFG